MTRPIPIDFAEPDLDTLAGTAGRMAVVATSDGKLDPVARRLNRMTKGAVARAVEAEAWGKLGAGEAVVLNYPAGLEVDGLAIVKLDRRADAATARKAGASIAKFAGGKALTVCVAGTQRIADLALGLVLRTYAFEDRKTGEKTEPQGAKILCAKPDEAREAAATVAAMAEGVFFTRDLVSEPANVLTTTEFAARLTALKDLGLKIKVLEEADMEKLGMGALLGVGQGSESPSKIVVMEWMGGTKGDAPLALVGKGVVFDTGGISLKPAAGMEDMTMDMGGAGTVAGVMKALALRKAKANVVGLVGLVENMPDARAQRPGDVVTSMKGDTIEVINTDAEGRLVLADVLWYAQETYAPAGIVDLATLTGAIIIGLGHENAGVFSNDDTFANAFLKAAKTEGEGAWRMPLGAAYDKMLKSNIADMKNVGGRPAGSITAAQFLQRFVKDGVPWIHLDIAGVASVKSDTAMAPKGATGWGVLALDRLVRDGYEG
ncbi:leucyl aminopeptidase [Rhodobacterales bacterium HKCCE3408]|nr:leucyl aminopeptidase [Rhodobacterales bacterium HKCCE3408]